MVGTRIVGIQKFIIADMIGIFDACLVGMNVANGNVLFSVGKIR